VISRLKILILVNWKEEGKWCFLRSLNPQVARTAVVQPVSFKGAIAGKLNNISKYLSDFYVPVLALIQRKHFDVTLSWQMRLGICYGILKRIFHSRKPPIHIIQDFHIDLTRKRWFYRFRIYVLKLAIPGIDYFFCTSTEEEAIYSKMFKIPPDRFVFLPLVESPDNFEAPSQPERDYIFSFGNSDRDYDTLIRAVSSLNIKTYILSQKYKPQAPVPAHVVIISDFLSEKEKIQWVLCSRIVVLPLIDYHVSAGQISMLEVMSLAKPLIITENMATKEYAVHEESAMFFGAGNDKELAGHIKRLWDNREFSNGIGKRARQENLKLIDSQIKIFGDLLERCVGDM
jgi:glycosyltransferase involved in cell wall biosynthesis